MPDTSSCSTPALGWTLQTVSTCRVLSSPPSGIASSPTPFSGLEHLPTPIPNPEARPFSTHPLQTQASEKNLRQKQWQLQMQAVSTPPSMVSGCCSIHQFCHWDMTHPLFATGRLLEFYIWNRWPLMSASDLETVSYATWHVGQALAEPSYWQMKVMYWNTAIQQTTFGP